MGEYNVCLIVGRRFSDISGRGEAMRSNEWRSYRRNEEKTTAWLFLGENLTTGPTETQWFPADF